MDSTAELLFNISANADDATENIARFRALMGQNLDGIAAQFSDWAEEVFGEIETVKGAMIAATAGIAAAVLAAGMAVKESTTEYHAYAEEIYKASVLTGMHTEDLSALHSMAAKTGVDFGTLTQGLGRFENNIVLASQGSKLQKEAFAALGITQADVIAGQKNMLPLLEKVMDGFHGNASAVQQASIARDLFGKGGTVLIEMLSKGSEYMREAIRECNEYGLTLSDKDVNAAHAFTVAQIMMKEQLEGVATTIGKAVMPYLEKLAAAMMATASSWKLMLKGIAEGGAVGGVVAFTGAYTKALSQIEEEVKKARTEGVFNLIGPETTKKVKEAKEDFFGLATIVEGMKSKIAEQGTGWDRLANEVAHYHVEITKAKDELNKLHAAGKITADSYGQEQAALGRIPGLLARVIEETTRKLAAADTQAWGEAVTKSAEAQEKETYALEQAGERRAEVTREIADRESAAGEQGYAEQKAALQKQINDWAAAMAKKTELTFADWAAIDRITMEGLLKIDHAEATAYQEQLRRLHGHLDATAAANATEAQKLYLDYQKELEQYSKIEEQKTLLTAKGEQQRAQLEQMYATIRGQITQKYQDDLQKLLNSQGFQGVFGNYFGNLIRNNQAAFHQWSTSTSQALMGVRMALLALKEMGKQTFESFVQGMGQTIAAAIVGQKSIGQAMEQMLKSTLQSFAGQAIAAAIMATAWGFYWLMMGNGAFSADAFTAAAIFGSVGAAGAVAGSMMPSSSSSGAGAGSGSRAGAGGSGVAGSPGAAAGNGGQSSQQPNVQVFVQGHVIGPSGAAQLADIINQAVFGNSVTLYATHNRQGVPL